jgi:hypothetical protein
MSSEPKSPKNDGVVTHGPSKRPAPKQAVESEYEAGPPLPGATGPEQVDTILQEVLPPRGAR